MEMHIAEREKISYIIGKSAPPTKLDVGYEKWYAENYKVKRWLLMSMSLDIMKCYLRVSIWSALFKEFYDGKVYSLYQKAFSAKQGTKLLSVYYEDII